MTQRPFVDGPARGTVIATMQDGRYPNKSTGNHVAIFLNFVRDSSGRHGMRVINQWLGQTPKVSTIWMGRGDLPKVPSQAAIRDMRTYWVVYRRISQ